MANTQELHSKKKTEEREIASTRGEAQAMTAVGLAGGVGWAAAELLPLLADIPKTKRDFAIVAGIVAIGALGYAAYKHAQANKLEEEHKSWLDKVKDSSSYSLQR